MIRTIVHAFNPLKILRSQVQTEDELRVVRGQLQNLCGVVVFRVEETSSKWLYRVSIALHR